MNEGGFCELTRGADVGRPCYLVPRWRALPCRHGFGIRDVSLAAYVGPGVWKMPETRQVHGTTVHRLTRHDPIQIRVGDAFVTDIPGMVCAVRTADCVPILLCAPPRGVVGAVHAGWRGVAAGIVTATVSALAAWFHVLPSQLEVAIGPAIGREDYEVDHAVHRALRATGLELEAALTPSRQGHWWCDLRQLLCQELMRLGVAPTSVTCSTLSTFQRPGEFHSYRRTPLHTGRQVSFITWSALRSTFDTAAGPSGRPDRGVRRW
ncbi:MAG: peptidoglycan editing factor PgeF [Deltaproteobacteria bacterium]|nr:peptidoglycan editing factor PgeF [Deltaproteobacteria bacterium]